MRSPSRFTSAFTLAEILVAISVLALLVLLITQLLNNASALTTTGNKRIDADSQARPLFERIALDLTQMIQRSDVSCYVKTAATPMTGNDLAGFYSAVQGYYPTTPGPISVVAYRVNSDSSNLVAYNCLERMGKGLDWNGASAINVPVVFRPLTLHAVWPSVASSSAYDDTDPSKRSYEVIGPQVFRFEYYYLEKATGALVAYPAGWTSLSAVTMADVAAVVVVIAVIDPKSKLLLSNSQIATLAERLPDYVSGSRPGELLAQWQSALENMADVPRPAVSGIRLYERCFYISAQ